ncbi:MAG: GntR family transcriptional regulator [Bosea sp.]|jgi:GntR family transcriptional regulator of vanillate catabolism|nr:GntR family transcriptional regulator [Bosea sp. (in: a-proteobacteria)]
MATRGVSVTNNLREALLGGKYAGGARLNEVDLAVSLAVSRTPIRSALSTLAAEGLLEYRPNSGYAVKAFAAKDIDGIYAVRATLEGLGARLVAQQGLSDAHRGLLHKALTDSGELLAAPDWTDEVRDRWRRLNDRYHSTLIEASGNSHLAMMLSKSRAIPLLNQLRLRWFDLETIARAHDDHNQIFLAITAGQAVRAESLAAEHVYRSGQRVIEHWRKMETRKPLAAVKARAA